MSISEKPSADWTDTPEGLVVGTPREKLSTARIAQLHAELVALEARARTMAVDAFTLSQRARTIQTLANEARKLLEA